MEAFSAPPQSHIPPLRSHGSDYIARPFSFSFPLHGWAVSPPPPPPGLIKANEQDGGGEKKGGRDGGKRGDWREAHFEFPYGDSYGHTSTQSCRIAS